MVLDENTSKYVGHKRRKRNKARALGYSNGGFLLSVSWSQCGNTWEPLGARTF